MAQALARSVVLVGVQNHGIAVPVNLLLTYDIRVVWRFAGQLPDTAVPAFAVLDADDAASFRLAAAGPLHHPHAGHPVSPVPATSPVWVTLWHDRTLRALLLISAALAGVGSLGNPLLTPLILARSGNDTSALGLVLTALGAGGVLGGLILTLWRTWRRLKRATVSGLILTALFGLLPLSLNIGLPGWVTGAFMLGLSVPLVSTSTMTLWQESTPDHLLLADGGGPSDFGAGGAADRTADQYAPRPIDYGIAWLPKCE